MQPAISIQLCDWHLACEPARAIRYAVFVEEQGVPVELEWDDHDASSTHALARDVQGQVVGTGRLLTDGHIGRMAVLPTARGQGVGGAILQALMTRARFLGMSTVILNAQTHAHDFYARFGFKVAGVEFFEAGIAHCVMTKNL